jgi:hypothetical protein
VPSMPIICAAMPRSNVTRSPLRRSATMISFRFQHLPARLGHGAPD